MEHNELETAASTDTVDEVQETVTEEDASGQTETSEASETPEAAAEEEKKPVDWFSEIMEILETMLISVFAILLVFTYLMRPVTVDGRSMVPTLYNNDRLVMFRLFYKPVMGDVVVVNNHGGHVFSGERVVDSGFSLDECIIKRVIATEGHTVLIDAPNGALYVDGELQDEPYINELTYSDDHAFAYPITIPDGYAFVMGDNRNHSTDSRSAAVGLVKVEDVMGKAFFRYQPAKDELTGEPQGTVGFIK